jgi:hypothetical protein
LCGDPSQHDEPPRTVRSGAVRRLVVRHAAPATGRRCPRRSSRRCSASTAFASPSVRSRKPSLQPLSSDPTVPCGTTARRTRVPATPRGSLVAGSTPTAGSSGPSNALLVGSPWRPSGPASSTNGARDSPAHDRQAALPPAAWGLASEDSVVQNLGMFSGNERAASLNEWRLSGHGHDGRRRTHHRRPPA